MKSRKKSISLPPIVKAALLRLPRDDDGLLRHLYLEFRIPIDQYKKPQRQAELAGFIRAWNDASGRDDKAEEIVRYMENQRKSGKRGRGWPTFNGDYEPLASPRTECLSEPQWGHLKAIYVELVVSKEIGRDQLAYLPELRAAIAREFNRRTGRHVSGDLLAALIEAKCKRNTKEIRVWPTYKRDEGRSSKGFGDIDEIA